MEDFWNIGVDNLNQSTRPNISVSNISETNKECEAPPLSEPTHQLIHEDLERTQFENYLITDFWWCIYICLCIYICDVSISVMYLYLWCIYLSWWVIKIRSSIKFLGILLLHYRLSYFLRWFCEMRLGIFLNVTRIWLDLEWFLIILLLLKLLAILLTWLYLVLNLCLVLCSLLNGFCHRREY